MLAVSTKGNELIEIINVPEKIADKDYKPIIKGKEKIAPIDEKLLEYWIYNKFDF